jgi:hypothetical protein
MTFDLRWLNVLGLVFDVVGAFVLAVVLFISEEEAIELGTGKWSGETAEENLQISTVKDRLRQSRNAKIGFAFLALGFALQIFGNWPR